MYVFVFSSFLWLAVFECIFYFTVFLLSRGGFGRGGWDLWGRVSVFAVVVPSWHVFTYLFASLLLLLLSLLLFVMSQMAFYSNTF